MRLRLLIAILLSILAILALASLSWGAQHALATSDDLMRRWVEVAWFVRGENPYRLRSMTYPPSALPVFTPLVAPFGPAEVRAFWLGLNLAALAVFCLGMVRLWGRDWPSWLILAIVLVVAATKPVRGGIGLGQFHLIPTALVLVAVWALRERRPIVAGVLVGIALAKPTMILPFVGLMVVRGWWRALGVATGLQAAAWLGASAWLGVAPWRLGQDWLANARSQLDQGAIDVPTLLVRFWPEATSRPTVVSLVVLGSGFVLTAALRRASDLTLTAFCLFLAAVFTYHRPYDLVLLVPTLAVWVQESWKAGVRDTKPTKHPHAVPHQAGRVGAERHLVPPIVFSLLLVAPSHRLILGRFETWHEAALPPLSYLFLALLIARLAREASQRDAGAPWRAVSPSE